MPSNISEKKVSASDEKALLKCRDLFKTHRDWIQTFYSVRLPCVPYLYSLKECKEFCVGLLEKPETHSWFNEWIVIPEKKRYGVAHSLFLLRKVIPSSEEDADTALDAAVHRLTTPQQRTDPDFLSFIERTIPDLFQAGWDKKYEKYCGGMTLSTKSVLENPRSKGGARNVPATRGLQWSALTGENIRPSPRAQIQLVRESGKVRVVTSNPVSHNVLRPLHNLMYDYLSKKKWLLRGEASRGDFKEFTHENGEVIVSGDYESATDNIPHDVYRAMLRSVASVSPNVPANVWGFAQNQVRRHLEDRNGHSLGWTSRGQLMGSFLSFPFLCLLNYLCFRYSIRRRVPVKINGDDIVFRATREEANKWFSTVEKCGLVLSRGKTLVHERVFTLNSSMFYACDSHVRNIPFLRAKAAFSRPDSPQALVGQYHSFMKGKGSDSLRVAFLKFHWDTIWCTQRSLSRGLGMYVNRRILKESGLMKREQFYLRSVDPDLPDPSKVRCPPLPGWSCYRLADVEPSRRKAALEQEGKYFAEELVNHCWATKAKVLTVDSYWESVRYGTLRYFRPRVGGIKKSKLYQKLANMVKGFPILVPRIGGKRVWIETSFK